MQAGADEGLARAMHDLIFPDLAEYDNRPEGSSDPVLPFAELAELAELAPSLSL
jgi:hypothetical protein